MFPSITAQNPEFKATLNRATEIVRELIAQRISLNPRIYADQSTFGGCMIPESDKQDNSDLPGWATENWDGQTTLISMGVPFDLPIYCVILVAEAGSDNFRNVAQIGREMAWQGKSLAQAVGVAKSTN